MKWLSNVRVYKTSTTQASRRGVFSAVLFVVFLMALMFVLFLMFWVFLMRVVFLVIDMSFPLQWWTGSTACVTQVTPAWHVSRTLMTVSITCAPTTPLVWTCTW